MRAAISAQFNVGRVQQKISLAHADARLRAKLFAAGVVSTEISDDAGWHLDIDAPRAAIEPLFGLPDGDGLRLREYLKLAPSASI